MPPVSARPRRKRWVDVKEAADRAGVSTRTLFRWCRDRRVVARRLACGTGPWRVRLDKDGFPMDADARR
jgi:predicted site-specific integrase-resolvase